MTYEDTVQTLGELEGCPVAVDAIIRQPVPGLLPGPGHSPSTGILRRKERIVVDDPDSTRAEGAVYDVFPSGGFIIPKKRFCGSRWQDDVLEIDATPGLRLRIVRLVRSDGCGYPEPVDTDRMMQMVAQKG
jgi:hypothetical protein